MEEAARAREGEQVRLGERGEHVGEHVRGEDVVQRRAAQRWARAACAAPEILVQWIENVRLVDPPKSYRGWIVRGWIVLPVD